MLCEDLDFRFKDFRFNKFTEKLCLGRKFLFCFYLGFTGYLRFIVFLDMCNRIRSSQLQKSNLTLRQAPVFT